MPRFIDKLSSRRKSSKKQIKSHTDIQCLESTVRSGELDSINRSLMVSTTRKDFETIIKCLENNNKNSILPHNLNSTKGSFINMPSEPPGSTEHMMNRDALIKKIKSSDKLRFRKERDANYHNDERQHTKSSTYFCRKKQPQKESLSNRIDTLSGSCKDKLRAARNSKKAAKGSAIISKISENLEDILSRKYTSETQHNSQEKDSIMIQEAVETFGRPAWVSEAARSNGSIERDRSLGMHKEDAYLRNGYYDTSYTMKEGRNRSFVIKDSFNTSNNNLSDNQNPTSTSNRRRIEQFKKRKSAIGNNSNNFSILSHLDSKKQLPSHRKISLAENRVKVSEMLAEQSKKLSSRLISTRDKSSIKNAKNGSKSSHYLHPLKVSARIGSECMIEGVVNAPTTSKNGRINRLTTYLFPEDTKSIAEANKENIVPLDNFAKKTKSKLPGKALKAIEIDCQATKVDLIDKIKKRLLEDEIEKDTAKIEIKKITHLLQRFEKDIQLQEDKVRLDCESASFQQKYMKNVKKCKLAATRMITRIMQRSCKATKTLAYQILTTRGE